MTRISAAAAAMLMMLPAGSASAAGIPDLVGTWVISDQAFTAARVGSGSPYFDASPEPKFGTPDQAFTFRIDRQEGRAFSGEAIASGDYKEALVGVVRFDDASLLISVDSGTVHGRFIGEKLELCWTDALPKWNAVSCTLLEKQL